MMAAVALFKYKYSIILFMVLISTLVLVRDSILSKNRVVANIVGTMGFMFSGLGVILSLS